MKPFSTYPTLVKAFELIAKDCNHSFRDDWQEICPPSKFDDILQRAEEAAVAIDGVQVCTHLDPSKFEDVVLDDIVDPNDDCLETVATGDRTVSNLIISNVENRAAGQALDEVLESAYDGEFYGLLFRSAR